MTKIHQENIGEMMNQVIIEQLICDLEGEPRSWVWKCTQATLDEMVKLAEACMVPKRLPRGSKEQTEGHKPATEGHKPATEEGKPVTSYEGEKGS